MAQSWDSMRKEARRLETDLDAKLVDYSKLAASLQSTTRTSFESSRTGSEGMCINHASRCEYTLPDGRANRLTCLLSVQRLAAEMKHYNDEADIVSRALPQRP